MNLYISSLFEIHSEYQSLTNNNHEQKYQIWFLEPGGGVFNKYGEHLILEIIQNEVKNRNLLHKTFYLLYIKI